MTHPGSTFYSAQWQILCCYKRKKKQQSFGSFSFHFQYTCCALAVGGMMVDSAR